MTRPDGAPVQDRGRRVRRAGRRLAGWLALSVWPALPLLPMFGCLIAWSLGVL